MQGSIIFTWNMTDGDISCFQCVLLSSTTWQAVKLISESMFRWLVKACCLQSTVLICKCLHVSAALTFCCLQPTG
jgi:hypothetical protein